MSIRASATTGLSFNHTMIRCKDPKVTLDFYVRLLGMTLSHSLKMETFTLYFLSMSPIENPVFSTGSGHFLELTHNHGTERMDGQIYHSGNDEASKGFGHIAFTTPDLEGTCKRLIEAGVEFKKKPEEGNMRGIAFCLDPDRYWIELIQERDN